MTTVRQYRFHIILVFLFILSLTPELFPINSSVSSSKEWNAYVMYVSSNKEVIYKTYSQESDTVGFVYYRDKVLIVEDSWEKFGLKKVVYPIAGFISEKNLIPPQEKSELDKRIKIIDSETDNSKWNWEIIECSQNVFVKSKTIESSETVALLIENEKAIIIKEQLNFQSVWAKTVYPFNGFIKSYEAFGEKRIPYLALGISYCAKHIPYEKNLQNYFNPLGGYFEYSKTNWKLGFRIGYNYAESRLSTFFVKTDQIYFNFVYKLFSILNRKLETYLLAGGNYWFSSFENKKYGPDNTYFKLEKDCGPGYVLGGGLIYNLNNFFIEAQYVFFGSRQAEFGKKPEQGSFSNYSTLYPGSSRIEIIFGYRLIL